MAVIAWGTGGSRLPAGPLAEKCQWSQASRSAEAWHTVRLPDIHAGVPRAVPAGVEPVTAQWGDYCGFAARLS